jgi:holo-[acyl-carrier protein] synthase
MIVGVGTDIVLTERMRGLVERFGEVFLARTFTPAEREAAAARPQPLLYYCTRFAAKEAVFKALAPPGDAGCDPREVEVLNDRTGFPYATLRGRLQELAAAKSISALHVSVSDEDDYVVAFAVAEAMDEDPQRPA